MNSTLHEGLNVNSSVMDRGWFNFKSAFISVVDHHAAVIINGLEELIVHG